VKAGFLSAYVEGVVAKRLQAVEVNPDCSNQHEFNGVKALKQLLGTKRLTERPARFLWLGDENEALSEDGSVTWYDSRERHSTRSEYRLYFSGNPVMELAEVGDLLIVARRPGDEFMVIVARAGSTVENQLLWLFGVPVQIGISFELREFENEQDMEIDFAARFILEELGIEVEDPEGHTLDNLLEPFLGKFPVTAEFSGFARGTLPEIDGTDDPDAALLAWMDHEEKLFRRLERHVVADRLKDGFWTEEGADVDGFIKFSLSVQNRRKARTGYALEHHFEQILRIHGIRYDRGAVTESNCKPDFLFPGAKEYHDEAFPSKSLSMLGVKSTCKDRWRQVLSEAARIPEKHLLTLEPGISENQTSEMATSRLQLVLPRALHETYRETQRTWLMDVASFLAFVQQGQFAPIP
jgi:hypothetical protein